MTRWRGGDSGVTLVELVMSVAILGLIVVPLSTLAVQYFRTYPQTQARVADSHDMQIAAAYVSNDVGGTGVHTSYTSTATAQSVWRTSFPASYCGSGTGSTLLLLSWNTYTVSPQTGSGAFGPTSSVAYVNETGALHRIYCASGTTTSSDAVLVHGLQAGSVSCSTACEASPAPSTVRLTLTISAGSTDASATSVVLTGQRRPS